MKNHATLLILAIAVTAVGCRAEDSPVARAGARVRDVLTRKYGQRPAATNLLRNIEGLEWPRLFADEGLTGSGSGSVVRSNATEVVRSRAYDDPGGKHRDQVRLVLLRSTQSAGAARKGLFEIMGSGMSIMITDSTFRRIEHGPGDECYALNRPGDAAASNAVPRKIWFARDNIAVELASSGDRDLLPLAKKLDGAILRLPGVTPRQ